MAPWSLSRSRSKKNPGAGAAWGKNKEPELEPLEKKSGAGAVKKFAGSPSPELYDNTVILEKIRSNYSGSPMSTDYKTDYP